jgi:hypothetical protein
MWRTSGVNLAHMSRKFACDVRHVARVSYKCCAHLSRATRDVTFGPLCIWQPRWVRVGRVNKVHSQLPFVAHLTLGCLMSIAQCTICIYYCILGWSKRWTWQIVFIVTITHCHRHSRVLLSFHISYIQRGPKVTFLVTRGSCAQHLHDVRGLLDAHRTRILRVAFAWHTCMHQIHAGCARHIRESDAIGHLCIK